MYYLQQIIIISIISSALGDCVYSKVTCDFDLENILKLIPQLPDECQEIWNTKTTDCRDVYQKTLKESKLYKEVFEKLNTIELNQNQNDESAIVKKNWTLRTILYKNADLYECSNKTVYPTSEEYYDCLITKRTNMLTELNDN